MSNPIPYVEQTKLCNGCGLLVSRVDSETELCDECLWEYSQEAYYKYAADQEWGEEI